jgi:hypothetical protein
LTKGRVDCSRRSEVQAACHVFVLVCLAARVLGRSGLLVKRIATQAVGLDFGGAQSEGVRTRGDSRNRRRRSIDSRSDDATSSC